MSKDQNTYTAGRFAKKAGVTMKTIHHYHKEGLLSPSAFSNTGYRLYTDKDFERLQKILTLKYVGYSLSEIKEIIEQTQDNIRKSIDVQLELIEEKINHLKLVQKALKNADIMIPEDNNFDWSRFVNIINVVELQKLWLNQYRNASNLSSRIRLHDKFSTNKTGWFTWFFDLLALEEGTKVLELGCGNANLWLRNADRIPSDCQITLTDVTDGMLEDARRNLGIYRDRFVINAADAQNIPYEDCSFDMVIGDHMFYHVANRQQALSEIFRVLKPGGRLFLSTISSNHLFELKNLLHNYKHGLVLSPIEFSEQFGLENGTKELSDYFNNINLVRYEDSLVVTEAAPLVEYIASTSGNAGSFLKDAEKEQFQEYIESLLSKKQQIKITKDTGVFIAAK